VAGAYGSLDSMLNVAFPAVTGGLGLEVVDVQWIVVAFVLASGGCLIAAGRLGDLVGHHRTLSWGGLLSAAGLAADAAAPGFGFLVAGRVVQGLGTALVMASAPALITASTGEAGRARALGLFQMSAAVGLAVGPLLAGPMVATLGWRSVFWSRVPVGLALGFLASSRTGPTPSPASGSPADPVDLGRGSRPGPGALTSMLRTVSGPQAALGGALLLAAALASGLLAVNLSLASGLGDPVVAAVASAGVVLAAALVRQQRRAAEPVIALGLLRHAPFVTANLLAVVANGAAFVVWLFVPAYVVDELGHPATTGGLLLALSPAATATVAPVAGRLSERIGSGRLATAGLVVLSGGLGLAGLAAPARSLPGFGLALVLVGLGLGLFTVPNMAYVFSSLPGDRQGVAGGLVLTLRTVGIVLGVALLSRWFEANEARGFGEALGRTFLAAAAWTGVATLISGARRRTRREVVGPTS
jgi:MFS family permease